MKYNNGSVSKTNFGSARSPTFCLILALGFLSSHAHSEFSGTYWINNFGSGNDLRVSSASTYENIETISVENSDDWAEWEFIPNGDYYYIRNVATNQYIRPRNGNNFSDIYTVPTGWRGSWTQWRIEELFDGVYRFVNRASGKHMSPNSGADHASVTQKPSTYVGAWTAWEPFSTSLPAFCDDDADVVTYYSETVRYGFNLSEGGFSVYRWYLEFDDGRYSGLIGDRATMGSYDCSSSGKITDPSGLFTWELTADHQKMQVYTSAFGYLDYELAGENTGMEECESVQNSSYASSDNESYIDFDEAGNGSYLSGTATANIAGELSNGYFECQTDVMTYHRYIFDADPIIVDVLDSGTSVVLNIGLEDIELNRED